MSKTSYYLSNFIKTLKTLRNHTKLKNNQNNRYMKNKMNSEILVNNSLLSKF